MHIEIRKAGVTRGPAHSLKEDSATYIVQRKGKISFLPGHRQISDNEVKLGHIVVGSGGAKLEALQPLYVLPGRAQADSRLKDLQGDKYRLEPASSDRVEIILLRDGDVITSPDAMDSLICINRAPKVQVHSSATEQAKDKFSQEFQGVQEAPEDETEDEAAPIGTVTEVPVTQTVTQPSKSQPSATPHLPRDRSLVVAETPTTSRVVGVNEYEAVAPDDSHESAPVPQEMVAVTETFSTARTGHSPTDSAKSPTYIRPATEPKRPQSSPEVRVDSRRGKKRTSTESSSDRGSKPSAEDPSTKRVKRATLDEAGGDDDQNNLSDIVNADKNRISYLTKRKSRTQLVSDATPTKSSRSSQRSGTATTAAAYEGDPPQVATSNSAIKESSSAVKFLRKHGGAYLADVNEKCNVLCVRDGGLVKTMKIFQAVALGIPIVTDKWLLDSAKADGFLDLSSYKPSVDQQEKEWNFSLEKVWGISQTPFKGYCIYFTPALRKTYTNFREMERVCQTVGAEMTNKRANKNKKTIVLATGEDDPETAKMADDGEACYYKDLVTTSILRGKVELDGNEFKIGTNQAALSRRRGSRKST